MDITYLGHSSFRLKGKGATVITDPFDSAMVGIKFPKLPAVDIVTVSHEHKDHNAVSEISGDPFVVRGPGEYELKGIIIEGYRTYHDAKQGQERGTNTIFVLHIDGISILHVGDLGHMLSSDQVEQCGDIDVLLVPVGGHYTIDAKTAVTLTNEIEPSIVIPMHYKTPEHKEEQFSSITPVDTFISELGKEPVVIEGKYTVKADSLHDDLQLVVLR